MSHAGPKLSSDSMMLLEQSLLKVPVEVMRKGHRSTTKATEKEMASVDNSLRKSKTRSLSRADRLKAVESALGKLRSVHAKASCPRTPRCVRLDTDIRAAR